MTNKGKLNDKEPSHTKELALENGNLDKHEVAKLLKRNIGTIDRWVKRGWLTPIKYGGARQSRVVFKIEEVMNLLTNGGR